MDQVSLLQVYCSLHVDSSLHHLASNIGSLFAFTASCRALVCSGHKVPDCKKEPDGCIVRLYDISSCLLALGTPIDYTQPYCRMFVASKKAHQSIQPVSQSVGDKGKQYKCRFHCVHSSLFTWLHCVTLFGA